MTLNTLFLKKLLVAFVVGFAYVVAQKLSGVGPQADLSTWNTVWHSLLSGAVAAGLRGALVLLPGVNIVPSDGGGLTGAGATPAPPAKK